MIMNVKPITLEGERVSLQPMTEEHTETLFGLNQHPEFINAPYLDWFQTVDDARVYVSTALDGQNQGITLPFVIKDRESGEIVGTTRYADISLDNRSLEIGWTWYHPSVWRSRVNTECKYLLLRHGFETLGAVRIQLKTDLRNERSQQAITRLGAVREGVLRNHRILKDGYLRDTVMFSIIDSEWTNIKLRLEHFLKKWGAFRQMK